RQAANSGRSGAPMRTSSVLSLSRARPISAVATRRRVSLYSVSACSIASHRSSSGERFQRSHFRHTTQRRPLEASNASRRPTGNDEKVELVPSGWLQKRQVAYTAGARKDQRRDGFEP